MLASRRGGIANTANRDRGRRVRGDRRRASPCQRRSRDLDRPAVLLEDDSVLEGKALAAGREFVFQESMATLDDVSGPRSLKRLAKRLRAGEQELGWRRALFPFEALDQLLGLRIHLG